MQMNLFINKLQKKIIIIYLNMYYQEEKKNNTLEFIGKKR